MLETVPCQVHTISTDNDIQFAKQPRNRSTIYSRQMRFDMICEVETSSATGSRNHVEGHEHRLTKPNHTWTAKPPVDQWPPLSDCGQTPAGQRVERRLLGGCGG